MNSAEARFLLLTFHGSVVHFDPACRRLRHSAMNDCEPNVHAVKANATITLWWSDSGQLRPLGHFAPELCTLAGDNGPAELKIVPFAPELVALSADGRLLCAEAGGAVTCSRLAASTWESFLLVEQDDLRRLRFVLANAWLCRGEGKLIDAAKIRCVDGHMMDFDGRRVPIRDVLHALRAETAPGQPLRDLVIRYDGWKLERYVLYRPLAYLVAYGAAEIFACAEIAIQSLFEFGDWDGDVLLITDQGHADFAERLPPGIRGRVCTAIVPAHDVLDYTLARYRIVDLPIAAERQPIIYLDTDIVCDAGLGDLGTSTASSSALQACPEGLLFHDGDYYGRSLLRREAAAFRPEEQGYSSGLFAFRNVDDQRRLFRMIIDAAYVFAIAAG